MGLIKADKDTADAKRRGGTAAAAGTAGTVGTAGTSDAGPSSGT